MIHFRCIQISSMWPRSLCVAANHIYRKHVPKPVLLHGDFKASNLHEALDGRLLVLDWEFAYAGPCLMDIGQLFRWDEPQPFTDNFVAAYMAAGGNLPKNWRELIACFDLVNLVGLLAKSDRGTRREADCMGRIRERLQRNG